MKSTRTLLLAAVTQLAVLACSESTTGPGDTAALSHEISSDELAQALDTAPARVEVKLQPGTLVAREVELKTADEMTDEESVRGPVTAVSSSGDAGTITFAIGELVVSFTSDARFRNAGGDSVSMEDFVALVQDGLDAGTQPSVRAKRPPLAEPQAPGDATFEATDLRLRSAAEEPELELNVDADNYEVNDTPPPDAWLRVLGLEIEVVASTEIEADDDHRDEVEVEGMVASVDVAGGSVMLEDGTVILASAASFEHEDDDDEHLASLQAVADALNAGQTVKAEAEGAVESTDPLTIRAHEIEFEIRNGDGDDEADDGDDDGT